MAGMGDRRIVLVCGSALVASLVAGRAGVAQPAGEGGGSDIEMTPDAEGSAAPAESSEPQAPVKDPKLARKLYIAALGFERKGDQLARRGKTDDAKAQYDQAVEAFGKAIELGDDPAYTLALASAEDKAGDPASAYKHVKAVLALDPPPKADVLKKAQTALEDLDGKVGKVTLTVIPDGTQIMIDGKTVGESPMTEPLVLTPGTYTASFVAVGYEPKDAELKPEAGSESERKIELVPVKVPAKPRAIEPEPEPTVAAAKPSMLPVYIGGGATVALLATSIVYDFKAKHQHDIFTGKNTSPNDRLDARDNGKLFAHVADATLAGTVLAAAFTGYWYWFKVRPAAQETQPKVGLAPWVQPDASGLTAFGSF
jgi:hypothetical protein